MNNLIEMYLKDKERSWAPSTLTSERHRLNGVAAHLDGKAESLWLALKDYKPYGRLTIWTRVTDLYQWAINEGHLAGPNPYDVYRKKNERLFKHVYQPKKPSISFEEAEARIKQIPDESIRALALQYLGSGCRYSELGTLSADGFVVGKGAKPREVFVPSVAGPSFKGSYQTFRRALAKVGLRPHDLRKLFLSRAVELGANEFELCELAGWSSIQTASSYIKVNNGRTKRLAELVQGGLTNAAKESVS